MGIRSFTITSSNALNMRLKSGAGGAFCPGRTAGRGGPGKGAVSPGRGGVALFHHHEHGPRLPLGEQLSRMKLTRPWFGHPRSSSPPPCCKYSTG